MRGDRPYEEPGEARELLFTPHARGSTHIVKHGLHDSFVYPACAGIDLYMSGTDFFGNCLPRMRGDRPLHARHGLEFRSFTPHARGSTRVQPRELWRGLVYPACAGIDPQAAEGWAGYAGLPRMRGDRPVSSMATVDQSLFTPHARGSTFSTSASSRCSSVYPACAGIDLAVL